MCYPELRTPGYLNGTCFRCHTLAYVPKSGRIYSFGLGGNGQLGVSGSTNRLSPATVLGPFVPERDPTCSLPASVQDQPPYVVLHLYSGGDQSIVTATTPKVTPHGTRNMTNQILNKKNTFVG